MPATLCSLVSMLIRCFPFSTFHSRTSWYFFEVIALLVGLSLKELGEDSLGSFSKNFRLRSSLQNWVFKLASHSLLENVITSDHKTAAWQLYRVGFHWKPIKTVQVIWTAHNASLPGCRSLFLFGNVSMFEGSGDNFERILGESLSR